MTDLFCKWVETFPLCGTDSETLAKILVDEVVCQYGVPVCFHSDQGANLNSQVILSLCRHLDRRTMPNILSTVGSRKIKPHPGIDAIKNGK